CEGVEGDAHFLPKRCDSGFQVGVVEDRRAGTVLDDESNFRGSEIWINGDHGHATRNRTKINGKEFRRVAENDANCPKVLYPRTQPLGSGQTYVIKLLV